MILLHAKEHCCYFDCMDCILNSIFWISRILYEIYKSCVADKLSVFSCYLLRLKSILYVTLELQVFSFLAGYAACVWEIVISFLVVFQVKLESLKCYKILCCRRLQEYSGKHSYVIALCLYYSLGIHNSNKDTSEVDIWCNLIQLVYLRRGQKDAF